MSNGELNTNSPRTPTTIGRYEIVYKLGVGGMADVFLAHQPGPFSASKLVVIKQLRAGVLADDQFIHMFADESRIAVRLNHPNVVHTYEVVAEGNDYYLTLEFLDGKSLYQVLNRVTRERLPLDLHVWLLTQVLAGLQYAHELADFDGTPLGIVHRDVSPSNVFVTYGGEVKLLDFGIAKSASAIASTRDGIIKGKLGYAAPEQCLSQAIDGRTDVFAVGVMLWEAIARRKRTRGETDAGTYQARIEGTEPNIDEVCPDAPKELIAACNKALARSPEQRFQSALEFRQALEDYLHGIDWTSGGERMSLFMHEHFQEDFVAMRQRIDEHLGNSVRPPPASPCRELSDHVTEQGPNTTHSGSAAFAQVSTTAVQVPPASKTRRSRAWLLGIGILGALGIASGWFRYSSRRPTATLHTYSAIGTSQQANAAVPQANASPNVAPIPAAQPIGQVTVALMANPTTATLLLDGRRISNPYRAAHGRDATPHHFTASQPGYQTVERELLFDSDVEFSITLNPQIISRHHAKADRGAQANTPLSTPRSSQHSTGAVQASAPQPGEDLRTSNSRSSARALDETDPYKR